MPTFALNFSRPGAEVVAQYYNFFRLGRTGITAVQQASRDVAMSLSERIGDLAEFRLITKGDELPVFAFTTVGHRADLGRLRRLPAAARARLAGARPTPSRRTARTSRCSGWCAATASRIDLADLLVADLRRLLPELRSQPAPMQEYGVEVKQGFHH